MHLSEQADELLRSIYICLFEQKKSFESSSKNAPTAFIELSQAGLTVDKTSAILTSQGIKEGQACIRRHRLAERLMVDLLNLSSDLVHQSGCRLEHALHRGIEDRICTLLGHPKTCPHGNPIPEGSCCAQNENQVHSIIKPLSKMKEGEHGIVSYLHTLDNDVLKKIMSMNVLPGCSLQVRQISPSYVFETGRSQFAVDRTIADDIYIRVV
jgi:DtxR family Mn-dependent transcriptional regulator